MSMYVTTSADGYEEAMRYDRAKGKFLADNMTADQRELCDGNEHFAFCIEGEILAITHVKSREQILNGKYPDEVDLWFDEDGKATRGYLPCESWDTYYDRPQGIKDDGMPISEGDLHDRHASILKPCTKDQFSFMAQADLIIDVLLCEQEYVDLFNGWVSAMRAAQDRLDQFEIDYREGKI